MSYKISIFNNARDNVPKDYDLDEWLKLTMNPSGRLMKLVSERKKRSIPAATFHANFTGKRNLNSINKKLPFICIDIDRHSKSKKKASNDCLDMQLAKELLANHLSCYYCGYSLSGDNLYAIFLLSETGKLDEYYELLKTKLSLRGINLDESCKDYTRMRFFSIDKNAYYNPKAKPLRIKKPQPIKRHRWVNKNEGEKIESIINVINRNGIDITGAYEDWIKIAAGLSNEFGESGREYFHAISKYHSDYDYKQCDRKFDQCRKMNKTTIASVYKIASDNKIRY